jgi:hypothetical protein
MFWHKVKPTPAPPPPRIEPAIPDYYRWIRPGAQVRSVIDKRIETIETLPFRDGSAPFGCWRVFVESSNFSMLCETLTPAEDYDRLLVTAEKSLARLLPLAEMALVHVQPGHDFRDELAREIEAAKRLLGGERG